MIRLVLVLPLAPLTLGSSYPVATWPLHITVVSPFLTDARVTDLADALAPVAADATPFTVVAAADALFGRSANVPVTLIEPSDELLALRRAALEALRPLAAAPDQSTFTRPGFQPHITVKGFSRAHGGDVLTLEQLALVDMEPRSSEAGRTVLAAWPLGPGRISSP